MLKVAFTEILLKLTFNSSRVNFFECPVDSINIDTLRNSWDPKTLAASDVLLLLAPIYLLKSKFTTNQN